MSTALLLGLAGAAAAADDAAPELSVAVDWPAFLARHDLEWDWIWGSTLASTLSPRHEELHRCGPGGAVGQCCLEAAAPKEALQVDESFAGFIQLALPKQTPWGCSPTAVPPRLCCLPVPGENGGAMSGCHARTEKRWHFNQFFSLEPAAGKRSFRLLDKATKACYTLQAGAKAPTMATCGSSAEQAWTVEKEGGGFVLKNVGSGSCVTAAGAHEASPVTMGSCALDAKGANSWQPVCDGGKSPLAGWPCMNVSNTPPPAPAPAPSPSPPPPPLPPAHGDPVTLAACDGKKPTQQWHISASGQITVGDGSRCLGYGGVVSPCNGTAQQWGPPAPIDGFFQLGGGHSGSELATSSSGGPATCLQIGTAAPFCTGTVCPVSSVQHFTAGMNLTTAPCHNGDMSRAPLAFYPFPLPLPGKCTVSCPLHTHTSPSKHNHPSKPMSESPRRRPQSSSRPRTRRRTAARART